MKCSRLSGFLVSILLLLLVALSLLFFHVPDPTPATPSATTTIPPYPEPDPELVPEGCGNDTTNDYIITGTVPAPNGTPPPAPSNFIATASASQTTLSWENQGSYTRIIILRNYSFLAEVTGNATQFMDSSPDGTCYTLTALGPDPFYNEASADTVPSACP